MHQTPEHSNELCDVIDVAYLDEYCMLHAYASKFGHDIIVLL